MSDPEEKDLLIGRTLAGKYVIGPLLGGGAMGSVYKAHQIALDKTVAVKVMHRAMLTSPGAAARFHREARAASRLDHPNSMAVLDFGAEPDGLLYIVMEYLDGRDLLHVMAQDWPLSAERIVNILSQALAALAVAHDMGVIHRDLKPENIMVLKSTNDEGDRTDLVKVCDFGIAKMADSRNDDSPKLTTAGLVMGTPEYMSPEQARGETLDARSDLYSMGVILYHMLAGRTPFQGETALGVALRHVTDPPDPPSDINPAIEPALERVCLKSLSKRKEQRHQNAREMRLELRQAIDIHQASVLPRSVPVGVPRPELLDGSAATAVAFSAGEVKSAISQTQVRVLPKADSSSPTTAAETALPARPARNVLPLALGAMFLVAAGASVAVYLGRTTTGPAAVVPVAAATSNRGRSDEVADGRIIPTTSTATVPPILVAPSNSLTEPATPTATTSPSEHIAVPKMVTPKVLVSVLTEKPVKAGDPPAALSVPLAATTAATPPTTVATAAPLTVATAPTAVTIATAAPTMSPLDLSTASVSIGAVTTTGGLASASVRKSLNSSALKVCYTSALKAKGVAVGGACTLTLVIDDSGHVTHATLKGSDFLPAIRGCVENVARGARVVGADTGEASADISLVFSAK